MKVRLVSSSDEYNTQGAKQSYLSCPVSSFKLYKNRYKIAHHNPAALFLLINSKLYMHVTDSHHKLACHKNITCPDFSPLTALITGIIK